jgi:flagellar biosynthesis GTPase FlhF
MRLYLDLNKSIKKATGPTPNASIDTPTEKESTRAYDNSYEKQPVGVSGASATPDKPEVGKQWKEESPEEPEATEKSKKSDKEIKKSLSAPREATELLKSFNSGLEAEIRRSKLKSVEVEFLTKHLGYSEDDIIKGRAIISGRDRHKFNEWLLSRLPKFPEQLYRGR